MSNRFVRSSSYRHVHGVPNKKNWSDLRPGCKGDGAFITASTKHFALPYQGGGGPVLVQDISGEPNRVQTAGKMVNVHKGAVLDCEFNPFNYTLLATASEDCYVCVSSIPDGKDTRDPLAKMEGHQKKVTELSWNPTASNILATASADRTVKIWDIEAQEEKLSYNAFENVVTGFNWNENGSMLATVSKDKKLSLFDPRAPDAATVTEGHGGSKKSSVLFMDNLGLLVTIGFTKNSRREYSVWDPKAMDRPLVNKTIDQSAGVFIAHYDPDNSILWLAGRGDSTIKYFEMQDDRDNSSKDFIFPLSEFRDTKSQRGLCFLPKRACDTSHCEIASVLRVMRDSVNPVSFRVPRKSEMFQSDLFPDTYAGKPATSAAEWLDGKNGEPPKMSMKPGEKQDDVAATFVAKKSAAELQKELDAANAEIAKLKAEIAALKA